MKNQQLLREDPNPVGRYPAEKGRLDYTKRPQGCENTEERPCEDSERLPSASPRESPPICQHFDLGLPASRASRKEISVVYTARSVRFCYGGHSDITATTRRCRNKGNDPMRMNRLLIRACCHLCLPETPWQVEE